VFVCVCLHFKEKTGAAINTRYTYILYGRTSAYIDSEVERSIVEVARLCAAGIGIQVDMTAYSF